MQVNALHLGARNQPVSAMSSNGTSVVVWTDYGIPGDRGDIVAQRFDAHGHKLGGAIVVAGSRSPENSPSVAMDARGNFAVTWTYDFSPTDSDVHAAFFSASGKRIGQEIRVAASPHNEFDPSIAMSANGNFVVSYTYQFNSHDLDVKAVMYRANGTVARKMDVAVSTRVESQSHVAMAPDGRFAIAFLRSDDIVVQSYSKTGTRQGIETVAAGKGDRSEPALAMDSKGNAEIVWQENVHNNWNVYARSMSSNGHLGNIVKVQATAAQETAPSVAIDWATDRVAVGYQSRTGGKTSIKVTELSAKGAPGKTWTMDTGLADPSLSAAGWSHRFLVVSQTPDGKGGSHGGIFARFATF
jgi:hypothetical protein